MSFNILLIKHNKFSRTNIADELVATFDTIEEAKDYMAKQKKSDKQWEYYYCCQWKD